MYITSNDWSKDYLVQGIPCLVHLIFTWTGPSPAVQVDLVQGIHLPTLEVLKVTQQCQAKRSLRFTENEEENLSKFQII